MDITHTTNVKKTDDNNNKTKRNDHNHKIIEK